MGSEEASQQPSIVDGGTLANASQSIFAHLERGLLKSPHKPAVICMHQHYPNQLTDWLGVDAEQPKLNDGQTSCLSLTYTQLHRGALKLVAGLVITGIQPGATVLCMIPNGVEYAVLLWACAILRLTLSAVDPVVLEDEDPTQLQRYIRSIKPALVLVPDSRGAEAFDSAISRGLESPWLVHRLLIQDEEGISECPLNWQYLVELFRIGTDPVLREATPLDEATLLAAARRDDPDRIHSIHFTSGTSAHPKGCPMRVGSTTHILESQAWLIEGATSDRVLQQAHNSRAIAPCHTLQTWRVGGAIVMSTGPSFAIKHTVDAILHHHVTFLVLSPAMVHALGQKPAVNLLLNDDDGKGKISPRDCVRAIMVGGDAVTRDVLTRCATLFPRARVCVNQGMSEGGGFFAWPFFDRPIDGIPYFGEICPIGVVAPGTKIWVGDASRNRPSPRRQPGELHLSSDSLIRRYLDGADPSAFSQDTDGTPWMNTHDLAAIADDGMVYLLGRSKDAITYGGTIIIPAALESCIDKYTGGQSCVVGVPHHTMGHEPFVALSNWNGFTEDEIANHVVRILGDEYAVKGIVSLEQLGMTEFPVNTTHKIIRSEMQKVVTDLIKSGKKHGDVA